MTNTHLTVAYDTNRPARDLAAYRVTLAPLDAALRPLAQTGAIANGTVYYEGVYPSLAEAASAASAYIACPHVLAEYVDLLSGEARIYVERHNQKRAAAIGWNRRVLASVSPSGTFIAR